MRPIPNKIKKQLEVDVSMYICAYRRLDAPNHYCGGKIEWEHAWMYSGKQINEVWAIIGCCTAHNRSVVMDKAYNRYIALLKAKELEVWEEIKVKYPKIDWDQEFNYLSNKYEQNKKVAKSVLQ